MPGPVGVDDGTDEQHLGSAGPSHFEPRRQLDLEVELVGPIWHGHRLAGDSLEVSALGVCDGRRQWSLEVVSDDGVAAIESRSLGPELAFEDPCELERRRHRHGDLHRFADRIVDRCGRQDCCGGDVGTRDLGRAGDANWYDGDPGIGRCLQFHLHDVLPLGDLVSAAEGHSRRQVFHPQGDFFVEPSAAGHVELELRFGVSRHVDGIAGQLQLEAGLDGHRRSDFQTIGEPFSPSTCLLFRDDHGELAIGGCLEGEGGVGGPLGILGTGDPFAGVVEHGDLCVQRRAQSCGLQIHHQCLALRGFKDEVVGVADGFDAAIENGRKRDGLGRSGSVVRFVLEHVGVIADGQRDDVGLAGADFQATANRRVGTGGNFDGDRRRGQVLSQQQQL